MTINVCAMDISYIENSNYDDRVADYAFSNGLGRVWRLGESAIVNYMGKVIIDYSPAENTITPPNGLIALLGENDKIGFFNAKGEQVTEFIYDAFLDVHEKTGERNVGYINTMYLRWGDGLILAEKQGEYFVFDYQGNLLWQMTEKPVAAYDGFIAVNHSKSLISKIMINQIKRPLVYLDGDKVAFSDAYPFIECDRTMVPLRAVFEKAGAEVNWNGEERLVTISMEGLSASMNIGDRNITVDGEVYETDVAPVIIKDRTYIPLRAFSEGLGMIVRWDEENYIVTIDSK